MSVEALPGGVFSGGEPKRRRERYRKIASRRRQPKTAFVFAGGGSRGSAQVGMLDALVHHGVRADAIYGCSVGALNGAGFAGQPDGSGVERLREIWRAVKRDNVFPHSRVPIPWRFLQQREAVFTNDGLYRLISDGLTFERIEEAAVPFEVVATSLHDGHEHWFSDGPALPAILASSALPALLPPVLIDGQPYIDGGVVDNVPIGRAIAQGAERVFALLCGPMHFEHQGYRRPVEAILSAFFIAVHGRFTRELASLPEGVEVVVFTVDSLPASAYDDFSQTEQLMTAGRQSAERVLSYWEGGGVGEWVDRPDRHPVVDLLPPPEEQVG